MLSILCDKVKLHCNFIFRFTLNTAVGKAQMHYKRYSCMSWEPQGDGLQILTVSYSCSSHLYINKYVVIY